MTNNTLRPIAVLVEEPDPGRFHWVLVERGSGGKTWTEVQRAGPPAATYRQAMADGLLALQALVDDLDIGPRRTKPGGHGKQPAAPRRPGPASSSGAERQPPARRSLFGFGPAR